MENALPAETVTDPEVAPLAITNPLGTVRFALLPLSETALQPTDGWLRVTVQVLVPPGAIVAGVHVTEAGATPTVRLTVKLAEPPFAVAVIVADWLLEILVIEAVNVAELALAGTVTEPGTMRVALVLVKLTVVPVAADLVSVTVQVVWPLAAREAAAHCKEETIGRVASVIVAVCEDPFKDAVMVGVSLAVNCLAVATNVALADPEGTVTDAWTGRFAELDARLTVGPLEALTVTVHVLDAPGDNIDGEHTMLLIVGTETGPDTVPPVVTIVIPSPAVEAPKPFARPIVAELVPESVTVTVATIPLAIVVAFIPYAMHV